jgi:hypothetical protein
MAQQAESLFQTRIVPLRAQWSQLLTQKKQDDQARNAELLKQMQADAAVSGKLQAERTLLRERAQRGEISQADAARADQQSEQQVLTLHRKYDALDDERAKQGARPYWAATFSRAEAGAAARAVAEGRTRVRIDDDSSEIGKDAHRAADLTLSIQRNQYFATQRAMTPQAAQSANAMAQTLISTLQQKYSGAAAADYRDRVGRLVQQGAAEQRPVWERDAAAARESAQQATAAAAATAAQQAASARADAAATASLAAAAARNEAGPNASPAAPAASTTASRSRAAAARRPAAAVATPVAAAILPQPSSSSSGVLWTTLVVVLLVGGGAGVLVLRSRKPLAPLRFAEPPAIPLAPSPARASDARQAPPAGKTPQAARGAGLKELLFAQQRDKYQSRYNDALDDVTAASVAPRSPGCWPARSAASSWQPT